MPLSIDPLSLTIGEPEPPVQFDSPQFVLEDVQIDTLTRIPLARTTFGVDGAGLAVAVLDTGLRVTHEDFAGRIPAGAARNFTSDDAGAANLVTDTNGHGTNVTGLIAAGQGRHTGVAPRANIVPLKVLPSNGRGSFQSVINALQWVLDNAVAFEISAVCMSLGDQGNYGDDPEMSDPIRSLIRALRDRNIAVCIAAGNDYAVHQSPGMSYPAIIRESISVGAVYDADEGSFSYASGATAFATGPDRITPFSQRLHPEHSAYTFTDVFAPGAPATSSGNSSDTGESVQHGTSQATPVATGIILLMQDLFKKTTGRLPSVDLLVQCLRAGAVTIVDGDDESDNVPHTHKDYLRVDAYAALDAVRRHLQRELFGTRHAFRTTLAPD